MASRQVGGREVLLVQGLWPTGCNPSKKTKEASKPGSNVTILRVSETWSSSKGTSSNYLLRV